MFVLSLYIREIMKNLGTKERRRRKDRVKKIRFEKEENESRDIDRKESDGIFQR